MKHPFYGPSGQLLGQEDSQWMGLLSMSMYLLFWAGALVVGVRLFKEYNVGAERSRATEDEAISILRVRYAKGEIGLEEFKQRKAALDEA